MNTSTQNTFTTFAKRYQRPPCVKAILKPMWQCLKHETYYPDDMIRDTVQQVAQLQKTKRGGVVDGQVSGRQLPSAVKAVKLAEERGMNGIPLVQSLVSILNTDADTLNLDNVHQQEYYMQAVKLILNMQIDDFSMFKIAFIKNRTQGGRVNQLTDEEKQKLDDIQKNISRQNSASFLQDIEPEDPSYTDGGDRTDKEITLIESVSSS